MFDRRRIMDAARGYLRENPDELKRAAKNVLRSRFELPLAALRWLASELIGESKAHDVELTSAAPGLKVGASVVVMKTKVRGEFELYVDSVEVLEDAINVTVRLESVRASLVEDASTPVAALIKSGALDLSQPANLIKHFVPETPMMTRCEGSVIEVNLMKHPRLADSENIHQAIGVLSSLVCVRTVDVEEEHFGVEVGAFPHGFESAVDRVNRHVVGPTFGRVKNLLVSGSQTFERYRKNSGFDTKLKQLLGDVMVPR